MRKTSIHNKHECTKMIADYAVSCVDTVRNFK